MKTLEELKAKEARIYAELKPLREAFEAKQGEWCAAYSAVQKYEMRVAIEAELVAEKAQSETLISALQIGVLTNQKETNATT
jgi:hypothetical protein